MLASPEKYCLLTSHSRKSEASVPSLSYLSFLRENVSQGQLSVSSERDWFHLDNQRWVLEHRLAALVKQHIQDTNRGIDTSFTVHHLTMAHCDFVYWRSLWEVIHNADESFKAELDSLAQVVSSFILRSPTYPLLMTSFHNHTNSPKLGHQALGTSSTASLTDLQQYCLHILSTAHKDLPGPEITVDQRDLLRQAYSSAIDAFVPHAKTFVEGFGFTEYEMDSALARSDMTPYEALFRGAQQSEMNQMQHLRPLIVGARSIWKNLESAKL